MTFRPYPGLTIACALLFAILCALGTWQLNRLSWKLALIARVNSHMAAPPVSLDAIQKMSGNDAQYRRVTLSGRFEHAKEARVSVQGQAHYGSKIAFQIARIIARLAREIFN